MDPVPFAIAGTGWRSDFYLRVAAELPDRFRVTGVLSRDPARARRALGDRGIGITSSLDELLTGRPRFVVLSVPRSVTAALIREIVGRGTHVLAGTPPAAGIAELTELRDLAPVGRVQVAEQYRFQPLHAARLAVIESGLLGPVCEAQVSVAHDYHGMDLLRHYLGVAFEPVTIVAGRFGSRIVAGPDRSGPPAGERVVASEKLLAWLDFDGRLGVHDFTEDLYFSWIRAPRLRVRGERGEIDGTTVRHLVDLRTPVTLELLRRDTGANGDLEGFHHAGITLGEQWVYRNPFAPGRLADDEIAVATCLERMAAYVEGGEPFCSLAEAAWDQELAFRVAEAADSGRPVRADGRGWAALVS